MAQTPEEMHREMTERPVQSLVLSLAAPAIAANLVTSLYNLVDTFFVGQLSTAASGAIGISFVAMTTIQGLGFYVGQGTGNAMSRYLGAKDNERACEFAALGLALTLGIGTLIAIVGNLLLEPICRIAGATPTIMPYAKSYIGIILLGAPFMASSHSLNFQLRMEGESFYSMIAIMVGAVLNMALTPFLVFVLNMGITGSALATVICEFIGFCLLIFEMQHTGITPLSAQDFRIPNRATMREVNNGGLPSLVRQMMLGVATTLLNNAARPFGDATIAGIAIVQRISSFANYVQIGIGQGFQPLLGYNLGAQRFDRIRKGFHFSIGLALSSTMAIGLFTCIFAPQLIRFFRDDMEVVRVASLTLRLLSFTVPLTGIAMITNFLLQTSGKMWRATFLGACRLGLVLAPTVTILSSTLGLLGVQIAQPVTDVITTLIALPMAHSCLSELKREEDRIATNEKT